MPVGNILPSLFAAGAGGGAAIAQQPVSTAQSYIVYKASSGTMYAVHELTGVQVSSHATDAGVLLNVVWNLMPTDTDATDPSGGRITLFPGYYPVLTPIVMSKYGQVLEGMSLVQVSVLQQGGNLGTARGVLELGTSADAASAHPQHQAVRNLHIIAGGATYTGRGMNCWGTACIIEDVVIQETYEEGFYMSGSAADITYQQKVNRVSVINYGYSDITAATMDGFVVSSTCSDVSLDTCEVYQGTMAPSLGRNGFNLAGAGGMVATNCHAWNNKLHGCVLPTNGTGTFIGCQFESNGGHGLSISSGCDANKIIGCNFYANGVLDTDGSSTHNSIYAVAALRTQIIGCRFSKIRGESGVAIPNINRHIYFDSGCDYSIIQGCSFNDAETDFIVLIDSDSNSIMGNTFGLKITYSGGSSVDGRNPDNAGIYIVGSSQKNLIQSNIFEMSSGSVPAYLEDASRTGTLNEFKNNKVLAGTVTLDSGSLAIVEFNTGYVTESYKSFTVLDNNTTVVVAHGLSATPTHVLISFKENPTVEPTDPIHPYWTADATNVTINTQDIGGNNWDGNFVAYVR